MNLIKGHGSLAGAIRPKPEQAGRSAKSAAIFEHLLVEAVRPDRTCNPRCQGDHIIGVNDIGVGRIIVGRPEAVGDRPGFVRVEGGMAVPACT